MQHQNSETDFQRDKRNAGALVNTNNEALAVYKAAKVRFNKINRIDELAEQVNKLSAMMEKILKALDDSNHSTSSSSK